MSSFPEVFFSCLSRCSSSSLEGQLDFLLAAEISQGMQRCPIQDPFLFRIRFWGLKVASLLLDDRGELKQEELNSLRSLLQKSPFPFGPRMEGDFLFFSHLLRCLQILERSEKVRHLLQKFSLPLCHRRAEEVVKESLWPEKVDKLQTVHVRKSVCAAWFCFLRQSTGSCFASAPAILVQKEEPERFLQDLYDLLTTGQLTRMIAGKLYSVPFSPTSGEGDLQRPLASFAKELLPLSPGLRMALEAGGVLAQGLPLASGMQQIAQKMAQLDPFPATPEVLFRQLILQSIGLTEREIEEEKLFSRRKMVPLLMRGEAVFYEKPSERAQKVADFKRKLVHACSVFRSVTESSLLRSWEYSLASFCDVKVEFSRWNLYVGLGLHPDEKGGVGSFLLSFLNQKLRSFHEEIERLSRSCQEAQFRVRSLEGLLQRAVSDARRHQLGVEMAAAMQSLQTHLDMRDREVEKAEALSQSFSDLIRQYAEKLGGEYFQEVFDPFLRGVSEPFYEDRLAGFRLVYKHGRSDASLWTPIHSQEEYVRALCEFFSQVESQLVAPPSLGSDFVAEVTTALLQYVQEPTFVEEALARSQAHGRLSPWEYVSGGTMQTLVQAYRSLEKPLTESLCIPRSPEELFRFFRGFAETVSGPLLAHSPIHAFVFYPEWMQGMERKEADQCRTALEKYRLTEEMQEFLAERLSERLSEIQRPLFLHRFRQQPFADALPQFRKRLIDAFPNDEVRRIYEEVDALCYRYFPLFSAEEASCHLSDLLRPFIERGRAMPSFEKNTRFIGAADLLESAMAFLLSRERSVFLSRDLSVELVEVARNLGVCYSRPILFGDTNWSNWIFGWVFNPSTLELEIWRVNRLGTEGFPMSDWKRFYTSCNEEAWVVLPKREEYVSRGEGSL